MSRIYSEKIYKLVGVNISMARAYRYIERSLEFQVKLTLDSLPIFSTTQSIALLPLLALDDTVLTMIDSM